MKRKGKSLFVALLAILLVGQGLLQAQIFPQWQRNYSTQTDSLDGLSPDQLLAVLAGFRELVAGILWVQADQFFETGQYDAILPIIQLVVLLDPRQVDVYATGMWHIAYNFTDEQHRSDRRYIPPALALGQRGMDNTPYTYEIFFETGWIWYHKIEDGYDQAVARFLEANERDDIIPARRNLLARAFLRNGQVQEALDYYFEILAAAEETFAEDGGFAARQNRDTIENNLDNHLIRMVQRGWLAAQQGQSLEPYDVYPPFDTGFSVRVTVTAPRVLQVEGTWNVRPVGTRIRFILRDEDFANAVPGGMVWDSVAGVDLDPPRDVTFLQDQLFVRNQRFNREVDMSRDPTMYPFTRDRYVLEFFYTPRNAPDHIQDKFGWNGEGMTDSNFLNLEVRPGSRVMYTTLELTRDQILRVGEWDAITGRTPVVQTPNYRPPSERQLRGDLIVVPGLRTEGADED